MRRNSTSSVGALHPVLFFIFIYGISLMLAIFVCRTVYFSINGGDRQTQASINSPMNAAASKDLAVLK